MKSLNSSEALYTIDSIEDLELRQEYGCWCWTIKCFCYSLCYTLLSLNIY